MTTFIKRAVARGEDGYAMIAVLTVLLVATIVAAAAVSASDNDRLTTTQDKERKQAYAAAEAGVADYLSRLTADGEYWRNCGVDPSNRSLNPAGVAAGQRGWMTMPGTRARYSVEVLPARGAQGSCDPARAEEWFIDGETGTFRIRSTGQIGTEGPRRTVVATFRRKGFLDYVYFTDYEVANPEWSVLDAFGRPTRRNNDPSQDIVTWAKNNCARYYREGHRQNARYTNGQWQDTDGKWNSFGSAPSCGEIQFIGGDQQRGPFHTNDEILVCGNPAFGRKPDDEVEVVAPTPNGQGSNTGWRNCGNGAPLVNDPSTANPNPNVGTWFKSADYVEIPPSNTELNKDARPQYRFVGVTKLKLEGDKIRVVDQAARRADGTVLPVNTVMDVPDNGVLYVNNDPNQPCQGYQPIQAVDAQQPGCGDLWVKGTYGTSLTLGAANDIVINEDVIRQSDKDVLLGLIANQWIRVHHPVKNFKLTPQSRSCDNNGGPGDITIHAALLAVNDSFTVDRYWCGNALGTLTVVGAIAQRFRGPVGTGSGGQAGTGYIKNYHYDDRLRFRTPPRFIDPLRGSWRVSAQSEQVPAA
jgi:hypothetical protein